MRRRDFIKAVAGTSALWPLAARAQQGKPATIGILTTGSGLRVEEGIQNFREALRELGHVEGQNFVIELRSAESRIERLPAVAAELVHLNVDVIVAISTPAARAAKQVTKTIPIVAAAMGDPVQDGLVESLARPGGNLTGTAFLGPELVPKRLALLRELLPKISRVGTIRHPEAFSERTTNAMTAEAAKAADALGLQLQFVDVHRPDDFDGAFARMANDHAEAVFTFPSTMLFTERQRLVDLAAKYRLPAEFNSREFVQIGGLMSYGSTIAVVVRRAALYVDKILKGAKPADLPVEQPATFELAINLKTAKALGLEVPLFLQQRADEVIE